MTLSAASVFPPDKLGGMAFRRPQVPHPNAIVFCTDSRLTFRPGGKRDIGNKVFQIASGIGLVFAGNVNLAHFAINRLTTLLRPRPSSMRLPQLIDRFSRTFRKAHKIIQAKTPPATQVLLHTEYLVGYHNAATDRAVLVHFSSPSYSPSARTTPSAIGSTCSVRDAYLQSVRKKVEGPISAPASPMEMATVLLGTLQNTIDSGVDESIGGVPEAIIMDAAGVKTVNHIILSPDLQEEYRVTLEDGGWVKKDANGKTVSKTEHPPYGA